MPSISVVVKSFQVMINIIISTHFQNARCIVQFNHIFRDFSVGALNTTIPQYVNPSSCVTGCDHYIISDPLAAHHAYIIHCLTVNKEYTFKGVFFLGNTSIDNYKFNKFRSPILPIYAAHSIFIKLVKSDFVISAFDNWELDSYSVLNRWNILENKFENDNIDDFFSNRRRKRLGGVMKFVGITDQLPVILTCIDFCLLIGYFCNFCKFFLAMSMGSEVILMFEFGKSMNMTTIIRHEGNPDVPIFVLGKIMFNTI